MTQGNNITTTKVHQDSKLGTIPDGWEFKTLDEIGSFSKGKGISKNEILESNETGHFCVRYAEIYTKYHNYTEIFESRINDESANNSNEVQYGDILFAGSGETLEDIGKAIAYLGNEKAYAGGDIIIFRQESEDPKYLGFLMNNDFVRSQLHKLGQGHSVVHVYGKSLKKVKIVLPPLPEQQKIAQILATWDVAINKQETLIKEKQEQKKALMQQLLTGKKRFAGFDEVWEEKKLGEIALKKSSNLAANSISELKGVYKVYGATGFLQKVDFYNEEEEYISIVKDGAGVGRVLLCEGKSSVLGTLDIIRAKNNTDLYFLYLILSRINFKKYIIGSTIPHIYFKDYKLEKILIPSLKEQQKIAEVLTAADNEITTLQQQLQQLKTQKQGLMQQLLTGNIRVNTGANE